MNSQIERRYQGYRIFEAHFHFVCYQDVISWAKSRGMSVDQIIERYKKYFPGATLPPEDPKEIGKAYLTEMDRTGIEYLTLLPREDSEELCWQAAQVDPKRLLNFIRINPTDTDALERIENAFEKYSVKGVKIVPPAMDFHLYDKKAYPVYEFIQEKGLPVIVHMGIYGNRATADMRYANPLDVQPVARDFPDVAWIIPHFGAGFFRETLLLSYQSPNVFVDNSGKGSWRNFTPDNMSLKQIFSRSIDVFSIKRLLYGTDGGVFVTDYRENLLQETISILEELLPKEEVQQIMFDNAFKVFTNKWKDLIDN